MFKGFGKILETFAVANVSFFYPRGSRGTLGVQGRSPISFCSDFWSIVEPIWRNFELCFSFVFFVAFVAAFLKHFYGFRVSFGEFFCVILNVFRKKAKY